MSTASLLALLFAAALAAASAGLFHLRRSLRREREENRRLRSMLQLGSRSAQADLDALRRLRHDLRHYLLFHDAPPSAALEAALQRPLSDGAAQSWALSSLQAHYRHKAEALGFQADLHLEPGSLPEALLPDVCLVLSNLLENAVESLQREGGGWIRARSVSAPGYLSFVVGNSCSAPLRVRGGRYLSSKREGRYGIGLSTVQEIARRCGGSAEFSADGKEFRASVFLPCEVTLPANYI